MIKYVCFCFCMIALRYHLVSMYQEAITDIENLNHEVLVARLKTKEWQAMNWKTRAHPVAFLRKYFKKIVGEIRSGELKKYEKNIWRGFVVCVVNKDNLHKFLNGINLIKYGAIVWRSCLVENKNEDQVEFRLTFDWILENES